MTHGAASRELSSFLCIAGMFVLPNHFAEMYRMEKRVGTDKARQGKRGGPVLIVLISALVLLALGWFAVEMFGESIDNPVDNAPATPTQTEPAGNSGVNP
jgi:hypothetical protein